MVYFEIAIVAVLIIINGLLAMSELAVVSSRPARLKTLADRDVKGARRAMALNSDPGRFLSTVQIGITLVGVLSGAFSGATLGLRFSEWLVVQGLPGGAASALGVGIVVALITYASLIIGELVPKQVALRNPEAVAVKVSPAMTFLARIASPLVSLLDFSGKLVLRLMGQHAQTEGKVTDEEIKTIIAEAESAGVLEMDESRMISGVMRLGDRPVSGIMTPRTDVDWLDLEAPLTDSLARLMATQHSRLPVGHSIDELTGVVQAREMLSAMIAGKTLNIADHMRPAPIVYTHADALDVLALLRTAEVPMALVHDEYGHFDGIVTPADILEAIVGVFRADLGDEEPPAIQRDDGSWLIAGYLPADEMAEQLGILLPENRDYQTTAGFVLAYLQHLPISGESCDVLGWRFEIVDMDDRRIDKILAYRIPATRRAV